MKYDILSVISLILISCILIYGMNLKTRIERLEDSDIVFDDIRNTLFKDKLSVKNDRVKNLEDIKNSLIKGRN